MAYLALLSVAGAGRGHVRNLVRRRKNGVLPLSDGSRPSSREGTESLERAFHARKVDRLDGVNIGGGRHVDESEQVERIRVICIENPLDGTRMWHETMVDVVDQLDIAWLHGEVLVSK
jgi:hypothetical protein